MSSNGKRSGRSESDADLAYNTLCQRNESYIAPSLQSKIRGTRLLIAGCGIGSTSAEAAVRMGFEKIILADGDTVSASNLNRQAFNHADIGSSKVSALGRRLKAINPNVLVLEYNNWITPENAATLVEGCDLVFDTIDFLDTAAITAVHDQASKFNKPLITAVSAGWGAAACYFPPTGSEISLFRKLFGLPDTGSVGNASYVNHFSHFMRRIATELDPSIMNALAKALTLMEDGTPCPAPQVSAGSFAVASLAVTLAARVINGDFVTTAPKLLLADMIAISKSGGIDLTP